MLLSLIFSRLAFQDHPEEAVRGLSTTYFDIALSQWSLCLVVLRSHFCTFSSTAGARCFHPSNCLVLNAEIDSNSVGMSLEEMKQYQSTTIRLDSPIIKLSKAHPQSHNIANRRGSLKSNTTTLHMDQMKSMTKIDYGLYLRIAAKHFAIQWKQKISNTKTHFNATIQKAGKRVS